MKVGVVSDTYGNIGGLEDAFDFLRREHKIAKLFHLGHNWEDIDLLITLKQELERAKRKRKREEASDDPLLAQELLEALAQQSGVGTRPNKPQHALDDLTWLRKQVVRVVGEDEPGAVVGNYPKTEFEVIGGRIVCAVHNPKTLTKDDLASAAIILYGHTHLYQVDKVKDRYFLNPGHLGEEPVQGRPPTFALLDLGERPRFVVYDLDFEVVSETPLELETKRKLSVT